MTTSYSSIVLPGYASVRIYDEVSSTMDVARAALQETGAPSGQHSIVIAERQSSGRGRQGRSWGSSKGAFMGTYVFSTKAPVSQLSGYSLVVGVAIARVVASFGVTIQLKWPNDLVVVENNELKKLGGILIEVQDLGASRAILVGVGLNLTEHPLDVAHSASLQSVSGRSISRAEMLPSMSAELLACHAAFIGQGGFKSFQAEWESRSCFENDRTTLTIEQGERSLTGTYLGVDANGALRLGSSNGEQLVHSGHVTQLSELRSQTPHGSICGANRG